MDLDKSLDKGIKKVGKKKVQGEIHDKSKMIIGDGPTTYSVRLLYTGFSLPLEDPLLNMPSRILFHC